LNKQVKIHMLSLGLWPMN